MKWIHSLETKSSKTESENLNRQVTTREFKAVIKKLPTNKSSEPDGFTGEFHQTFKELTSIDLKLFQNKSKGGKTPKFILQGQHYPNSKTR